MPCYRTPFESVMHWPYLVFGPLGVEQNMEGFDLVADAPEGVRVSIGFDQRDRDLRTDDYEMEADSLPGQMVPIPVGGPSFDLRLTFNEEQQWEWEAAVLYVHDNAGGT